MNSEDFQAIIDNLQENDVIEIESSSFIWKGVLPDFYWELVLSNKCDIIINGRIMTSELGQNHFPMRGI